MILALRTFAALIVAVFLTQTAQAATGDRRLVLVTLDGLAWTEVFRGADPERSADRAFVTEPKPFQAAYVQPTDRARAMMPFLHMVMAKQGVLIGDRDHGSCAAVANDMWFSYPGYNEILTGRVDPAIRSNEHGPNANVTMLEWLNHQPAFRGKVEAVASWANFHDILNEARSGVPVNAGWNSAPGRTQVEVGIARMQAQAPRIWSSVRLDLFTHAYALETLRRSKPKVLFISYGETDDFAHDGHYDQVVMAAHRTDGFLAELWATLQADPTYAGKTTLIVTTDHGRGEGERTAWRNHGKPIFKGSDATWIAMIGPGVTAPPSGGPCASSSQIAATGLTALGLDWKAFNPQAGPPLAVFGAK